MRIRLSGIAQNASGPFYENELSGKYLFQILSIPELQATRKSRLSCQGLHNLNCLFASLNVRPSSLCLAVTNPAGHVVAEIEAEQALVEANRELIRRFEGKIQAAIARVWKSETPAVSIS